MNALHLGRPSFLDLSLRRLSGLLTVMCTKTDLSSENLYMEVEQWGEVVINISVTGDSGVGKSSFINAIRGLADDDEGAAPTGVQETTMEATPYPHPTNSKIIFWDLPGIGTQEHPTLEKFCEKVDLNKFDTSVIIAAKRFPEYYMRLGKKLKSLKKSLFYVRTHIDIDYRSEKRKRAFNEEAMLTSIRENCLETLQDSGDRNKVVFLISNHHPVKWDFPRLTQAILDILPCHQKECFSTKMLIKEIEHIQERLVRWRDMEINIAIVGACGVSGKSSFINAIRNLADDDEGAAPTGVQETTMEATPYPHPINSKIVFWDLPSLVTPKHPTLELSYCEKVSLHNYDTFLIFTQNRFTENDLSLAREVKSLKKSFFFILTHIDVDYRSEKRRKGTTAFNEEAMLKEIRENCLRNLFDLGDRDVFLISNHHPDMWDFPRLTQAIHDVLPFDQRECLTLSLTNLSTEMLKRKLELLRDRTWMVAAASTACTVVPVPGCAMAVDPVLIANELHFYKSQLGLPKENSNEFRSMIPENQERFGRSCKVEVMAFLSAYAAEATMEKNVRSAGGIPFWVTYCFLHQCLNELEETAVASLDEMTARAADDFDIDKAI